MNRGLAKGVGSASLALVALLESCRSAPIANTAFEQTYLRAEHNWEFRSQFRDADNLLNAFDYGHAILYETLIARRDAAVRLETHEFDFITTRLLPHPPPVPLEEAAVGPDYTKLVPEVAAMFEWAHMLHRQLYDIWTA